LAFVQFLQTLNDLFTQNYVKILQTISYPLHSLSYFVKKDNYLIKSDSFTNENCDQLHNKVLDKHTGLKAFTDMICQLEHVIKSEPSQKNEIIKIEFFLHNLNTSIHAENNQLGEQILEFQDEHKLNKLKTRKNKSSKICKQLKKIRNRPLKGIEICIVFSIFLFISFGTNFDLFQPNISETANAEIELKSKHLIQNLKGDKIDTHLSWRLLKDDVLHVNIINADKFPEISKIIENTLLSESILEIDNSLLHKGPKGTASTYYEGWKGALKASSKTDTQLNIPTNFDIFQSKFGEGEIIIELSSMTSADGFSGFTRTIADDSQSQILKSYITLYDVDTLSKSQAKTLILHEFGHAMGLAHSTAPEDLMHPTITTAYPYISPCNIDGIVSLYGGLNSIQVECDI
jgi:hypothetical protein